MTHGARRRQFGLRCKRLLDVVGAGLGIVLLSPILAWVALAALVTQGRPILFRQVRPGLGGRPFLICKFRTMRTPRPGEDWFQSDSERVTRLGRILRSTSADELPELWNVLKGEMSLVGPRPLLLGYLDRFTPDEARRHEIRPGVTGWAAVNGRHTLRFEDRLALDTWYVDNWSLALDFRILMKTVSQVLRREAVAATQDHEGIGIPDRFRTGVYDGDNDRPAPAAGATD